jgi:hypothetical protein
MKKNKIADKKKANQDLYRRLLKSCNDAERIIFNSYGFIIKESGFELPALIPQVYLHFDPLTAKQRGGVGPLARQRMDFLMLLPDNNRVVIELDGQQHYSKDGKADPQLYSKTMEEDRKLKLSGYQIFRFGGIDFVDKTTALKTMDNFFKQLLAHYDIKHHP